MNRLVFCIQCFWLIGLLNWNSTHAQGLAASVSAAQWRDSFLAKWQSGDQQDKHDAIVQLSALLLLLSDSDPNKQDLIDRLEIHVTDSVDAQMAIAFSKLASSNPGDASKRLLDLIMRFPDEPRVQRFRIALARSFRMQGQLETANAQLEPLLNPNTEDGRWALLEKAMILDDLHDTHKAIELLKQLAETSAQPSFFHSIVTAKLSDLEMNRALVQDVEVE